jgi:hypothetical protein
MKLGNFLSSINYDKKPLLDTDESATRLYPAFVVNRCLSYFVDTIFHANEMNCVPWLDNKSQFDFHRLSIRKKRRFSNWVKKETEDDIELIKQAYGYSERKAIEVLNIIGPQQMDQIRKSLYKGGTDK